MPEKVRSQSLDVAPAPVCVDHAELRRLGHASWARGDRRDERIHLVALVGMHDLDQAAPGERAGKVAQHALHRRAQIADRAVLPHDADHVGGVLDERAQPRLRAPVCSFFGERRALQGERHGAGQRREALLRGAIQPVS